MRSSIVVFVSFYRDKLMRLHLNFYRFEPSTFSIFGNRFHIWKSLVVIIFAIIATYTIQLSTFFCFRSFVLV